MLDDGVAAVVAAPPAGVKVLALDWGHTLMDERRDRHIPLDDRPAHLMPGVREALDAIALPLAVWANTREGDERHVRAWLSRAGLDGAFAWVITSIDAGARKPSRALLRLRAGAAAAVRLTTCCSSATS